MKKEKIFGWLNNKENLILLAILLSALLIRVYYFDLTQNQPLWWDGVVYGTLAKNMGSHLWDGTAMIDYESIIRPPLFPLLWFFLLQIGIGEIGTKFLLVFLPSILSVYFVFLIGAEMYNKRVGLISSFVFSVIWINLFYSFRMLTDIPGIPFLLLSIYFFIKSDKTGFNPKYFGISLFLLSLSTLMRFPNGLVFFGYFIFFISARKFSLLKKKNFWISGLAGLLPILIFFGVNQLDYGNIFPAILGSDYVTGSAKIHPAFAFNLLKYVPIYLKTVFFVLFLAGVLIALLELVLGYDVIKKDNRLKAHLLLFLILLLFYAYFIFYMRNAEDRYFLPTMISLATFVAIGAEGLLKLTKLKKAAGTVVLILVLMAGAYTQIAYADSMIKSKMETYSQMKEAMLWIKQNTPNDSVLLLGDGIRPYATYYSERKYEELPLNMSGMSEITADYLVLHAFRSPPDFLSQYMQENLNKWTPVYATFFDNAKTQPAVVVYKKEFY